MSILNKKGEGIEINWIIGAIVGILLGSVILTVGIQWYLTTTKTEDSFDSLIAKIDTLKEGEKTSMIYFLPEGYLLVSFSEGEDFETQRTISEDLLTKESCDDGKIEIPESCGKNSCLCVCSGSYKYGYEDSCIKDPLVCYPFTSEATKNYIFTDTECSIGVYREGSDNGVFTLFLQRDGNRIRFCSSAECVSEEYKKLVANTETLITKYQSCQEKKDDCSCSLDFTYLTESYGLAFYTDKIQLLNLKTKEIILEKGVLTKSAIQEKDTDLILVYPFSEITYASTVDETTSADFVAEHLVIATSVENIETSGVIVPENEIQSNIYKKEDKMYFVNVGEDLTSLPSCEVVEQTSEEIFPTS